MTEEARLINAAKTDSDGYQKTAWAQDNGDGTVNVHVITREETVSVLNVKVKKEEERCRQ